jgi:hypothetical protein
VFSPIAARRMTEYIDSSGSTLSKFAEQVKTTPRTLRRFRKTGKVQRVILDAIAGAMGSTREALLKPE